MKILEAYANNFGSYPSIEFKYDNLGLALVSGPTKAGKSTVLDLVCWILYGTTSKDLNADDVKSWPGDDETKGSVLVALPDKLIRVTRVRGTSPSKHDLHFSIDGATVVRGKDATDTQKLINQELGVDADLYIAASYIHQFTNDKFFTAKAKDRRETMERIADLSLPVKLSNKTSESRKEGKKFLEKLQQDRAKLAGKLEILTDSISKSLTKLENWDRLHAESVQKILDALNDYDNVKQDKVYLIVDQLTELDKIIESSESFDARLSQIKDQLVSVDQLEKQLKTEERAFNALNAELNQKISEEKKYSKDLGSRCPTCLGPASNATRDCHIEELHIAIGKLQTELEPIANQIKNLESALVIKPKLHEGYQKCTQQRADNERLIDKYESLRLQALTLREETNPYIKQLEDTEAQVNPFVDMHQKDQVALHEVKRKLDFIEGDISEVEERMSALSWLYDKSSELRGLLLQRAVKQINDVTNQVLERHFDATIRVNFVLEDSDKLEVEVTNEGYDCKYAQLSGGERAMLKLAFGIGYMKAAENRAGIKFHTLMLDEAFNGLDATLKVKAFGLLQSIEKDYGSIIVIDHSEELKQLFEKQFQVRKDGAYSHISATV